MREVTLFPACVMAVPCPSCKAEGRIKLTRPPTKDFSARCPKCKEQFMIRLNIRKNYRKNTSIVTSYSFSDIQKMDADGSIPGEIVDISKGGMAIESSSVWLPRLMGKEKRPLTFIFLLPPKNEVVKVKGTAIRMSQLKERGKFRMGIRFVDLDDEAVRKIGLFLWN